MKKTPTPVTILKDAGAPTPVSNSVSSRDFGRKVKSEPIRRAIPLSAAEEKRMLNEKLLTAAWNGDIKEVWDLLDKGADINTRNHEGETALHLAAHGGHSETVELLLAKKAEINAVDREGATALLLACCFKNIDAILALLEKGADVGIVNRNGVNPIRFLVEFAKKNNDILSTLEQGANMNGTRIRFVAKPIPKNNSKNGGINGA